MAKSFDTAILFLIFKQPEITNQVFQEIRKLRPTKLYVAADGPRSDKERVECEATRQIVVDAIDWPCDVKTRFLEGNIGCKLAVSSAISWVFSHEEQVIILEYDCLPHPSFFRFCEDLLLRYQDNEKVFSISGNNFQFGNKRGTASYYSSSIATIWGWATWKRAWEKWEGQISDYPKFVKEDRISRILKSKKNQKFWINKFKTIFTGENRSTWGFPWVYALMNHQALCLTPNRNLVRNIGFNAQATHAKNEKDVHANIPEEDIGIIVHPQDLEPNLAADEFFTSNLAKIPFRDRMMRMALPIAKAMLPSKTRRFLKKFLRDA